MMKYNASQMNELLVILMEECAEVQVAAAKCMRFGYDDLNVSRLESELGDLQCMVSLLKEQNVVDQAMIDMGERHKRTKLKQFSSLIG